MCKFVYVDKCIDGCDGVQYSNECEANCAGAVPVQCFADPCQVSNECGSNNRICASNYCGGCIAECGDECIANYCENGARECVSGNIVSCAANPCDTDNGGCRSTETCTANYRNACHAICSDGMCA